MNRILIFIGALLLLGCEKDPRILQPVSPSNLAEYVDLFDEAKHSNNVWLHAGNHPAFERETDDLPVHIRVFIPDNAINVQLHISDSTKYPDSLELYRITPNEINQTNGDLFGRFALKYNSNNRSRLARVSFELDDSLFISSAIQLRSDVQSTNTKSIIDLEIKTTPGGRAYINWSGAGIDESWKNLVVLKDQTGITFCAVETENMSFLFHNLINVSKDFTPGLKDPRMIERQSYSMAIYRYDNSGWLRNFREVEFVCDSTRIQSFDD